MNDIQDELGRALHRQSDGVTDAPISFEAVRGRAGRIRARRRAAVAGAVLAVGAAVAVPTVLLGGNGDGRGDAPPVVTTPEKAAGLDISDLPTGDAPKVPYVDGDRLHLPGGHSPVLEARLSQVAVVGERIVGLHREGETSEVVELDSTQFEVVQSWPTNGDLVVGTDGQVAWLERNGAVMVLRHGAPQPVQVAQLEGDERIVALTGSCAERGGCEVWFNDGAEQPRFAVVTNDGTPAHPASTTLLQAADIHDLGDGSRLRVGITEFRDDLTTCSGVTGPHADEATWTTCVHRPYAFSPDGTNLIAAGSQDDGIGDSTVTVIRVSDGAVVTSLDNRTSHAFVTQAVWEDDAHVLARVFQEGQWAIVRIGLDGTMEYAVEPRAGEDVEPPFVLATQP